MASQQSINFDMSEDKKERKMKHTHKCDQIVCWDSNTFFSHGKPNFELILIVSNVGAIIKIHNVCAVIMIEMGENSNEISFLFYFVNKTSVVYMRFLNISLYDFRSPTTHISQCENAIISINFSHSYGATQKILYEERGRDRESNRKRRVAL